MENSPLDDIHIAPRTDMAATYSQEDRLAIEHHYKKFFGGDFYRAFHEKRSVGVHVDIYTYGTSPDRPYVTLATSGMGAGNAPPNIEHPHFVELVTYVPHDWDFSTPEAIWLTRRLIEVARHPHQTGEVVSKHHTWCVYDEKTNVSDALFPGTLLSHWYFRSLIHEPKEIDHLILPSGRHVNFVWVYPITRQERHFLAQAEDHLELEYMLAEQTEIPIDLHRQCLVSVENRAARRARKREQKRLARLLPELPWMEVPCAYHAEPNGPERQ